MVMMKSQSHARGKESTDSEMKTLFANLSLGGVSKYLYPICTLDSAL